MSNSETRHKTTTQFSPPPGYNDVTDEAVIRPPSLQLKSDKAAVEDTSITPMHWLVLTLACLLLFGNYYCYDIPGALNVQLREWLGHDYDQWQFEMNALYTAYSAPNLIMPIVGGILVDTMGPTKMLLSFSVLVVVGQALFSFGVSMRYYWVMLVGRFLFGVGGESLEVAQSQITTSWFMKRSLGLALGLNLTCARLATALNDILSPMINANSNPALTSWFGVLTCFLSLLCSLGLGALNRPSIRRQYGMDLYEPLPLDHCSDCDSDSSRSCSSSSNVNNANANNTNNNNNNNYNTTDETGNLNNDEEALSGDSGSLISVAASGNNSETITQSGTGEMIRWVDVCNLPAAFWVLCLATVALYGAVNPFIHILSDFLQQKWYHGDPETAGKVMAIPDIISAIGSPLCGWLLDRVAHNAAATTANHGKSSSAAQRPIRAFFLPLSGVFLVIVHAMMGFTSVNPVFALIVLGLAYSLFGAALWPMIPHLVGNNRLLGTAYGVSTVALNIALTFVPLIVAKILNSGSYVSVEIWFIILSSVGLGLSIMVGVFDGRRLRKQFRLGDNNDDDVNFNDDDDEDEVPTALDDNQYISSDEDQGHGFVGDIDGSSDKGGNGNGEARPLLLHPKKPVISHAHLYDGDDSCDTLPDGGEEVETELVGDHHIVTIPKRNHFVAHVHSAYHHHHRK